METSKQNEIIVKIGKLKFKNANKIPNNIFVSEMKSGYEETSLVEFIFNKMKAYNSPYADAREVYSWSNVLVNYNFNIKKYVLCFREANVRQFFLFCISNQGRFYEDI
jgi:hypothetical protein